MLVLPEVPWQRKVLLVAYFMLTCVGIFMMVRNLGWTSATSDFDVAIAGSLIGLVTGVGALSKYARHIAIASLALLVGSMPFLMSPHPMTFAYAMLGWYFGFMTGVSGTCLLYILQRIENKSAPSV